MLHSTHKHNKNLISWQVARFEANGSSTLVGASAWALIDLQWNARDFIIANIIRLVKIGRPWSSETSNTPLPHDFIYSIELLRIEIVRLPRVQFGLLVFTKYIISTRKAPLLHLEHEWSALTQSRYLTYGFLTKYYSLLQWLSLGTHENQLRPEMQKRNCCKLN